MFFEILIAKRGYKNKKVKESADKGSFIIMAVAITVGYWLSYIFAYSGLGRLYPWNTYFILGFLLVITGLYIRISAIRTLEKYFTSTVTGMQDHKLVDRGLYHTIRHPAYLGQLIIFLGISTALSDWLSILGMMIPVLAAYLHRMKIEEKFLMKYLGQDYSDYQKKTKKLIPLVF
jgi:protein-S-isoprenylcysteine O-methyltransferase Ste14